MWSPQHYREKGRQLSLDDALVERAATAIEDFVDAHPDLPALLTLGHLADRAGISWFPLRLLTEGSRSDNYTYFHIRKRSGGHRLISVPEPKLMMVQRWIAGHILSGLPCHRGSFAFAPKSSIVGCAAQHCGARWLVKLDITGFFGSVSEIQVYRVFRQAGYAPLISLELARLCTHAPFMSRRYLDRPEWLALKRKSWKMYQQRGLGFLPQGAPTSPMLSNLIMRETDKRLAALAASAGLTYTRYSDDITFSTKSAFDREKAMKVVWEATAILGRIGLQINKKKTRIVPPGARKVVLGLLVDGPQPRLTREFRERIRQHLHYLKKWGPENHRDKRRFDTVSGLYRHILGLIDYAHAVDPSFASIMRSKFDAIGWSLDNASVFDATLLPTSVPEN